MTTIQGVLFDKDGTLFDFRGTWNAWAQAMLLDLAEGDAKEASRLGALIEFDMEAGSFLPTSPIIAGTAGLIIDLLAPGVPNMAPEDMLVRLNASAAQAKQVEAVPLGPVLAALKDQGLTLGIATNDAESTARAAMAQAGQAAAFDFIAGYDSGFGAKPAPGMCLAFAKAMELDPAACVMVGDSTHDLEAGRAAGMQVVAVLTGMALAEVLAPHADAVLPDIGHLPAWIAAQG